MRYCRALLPNYAKNQNREFAGAEQGKWVEDQGILQRPPPSGFGSASWRCSGCSSLDRIAAINRNRRPSNEIGRRARQEYGNTRQVIYSAPTRGRRAAQHILIESWDLLASTAGQIGVDPARQDGISLNVVTRPGAGERARQLDDAAFAGRVGRRKRAPKIDIIEPILMIFPPPPCLRVG